MIKRMGHKHYRIKKDCLNCGATVEDNFCTICGQENLELKEPFWHFIGHSISHYFHFDSKFFNTLIPLLTKPGQLTLDYIAGKRAIYLHPVSMYIFVSIVYFLVLSVTNHPVEKLENTGPKLTFNSYSSGLTAKEKKIIEADPGFMQNTTAKSMDGSKEKIYFKAMGFVKQQEYLANLNLIAKNPEISKRIADIKEINLHREDSTYSSYLNRQNRLTESEQDNFLDRFIKKQSLKFGTNTDILNLAEKYRSKLFFLLMPVFAFFVMVNFRKNKRYYVEHLVFTIHLFTAYFILDILINMLDLLLPQTVMTILNMVVALILIWYIYKALRTFYQRKRWITVRKIIGMGILFLLAFSLCNLTIASFVFITA